ncbi:hypothetical protein ACI65C_000694 [Semiaphis heraclei]
MEKYDYLFSLEIFWILIFVCMLLATISGLCALIDVWINYPSIIFIDNTNSAIQEIPFPMITICPSGQIRKSVWEKYSNTNSSYWENLQQYRHITCSSFLYGPTLKSHTKDYIDHDWYRQIMKDCAISCSELFQSEVKWQNTTLSNFCQFVQPTLSIFGLCYAINMMPIYQILNDEYYQRSKWTLDVGYSLLSDENVLFNIIPARSNGVSYYHRLRLKLHTTENGFSICPNSKFDEDFFLVIISNPGELFAYKTRAFVASDTYKKIQITPFVKRIKSDLMWRSLKIRKCYLQNERKLSTFQFYTESNCNEECKINLTISICGCAYYTSALALYLSKVQMKCNCLPTCSVIEYDITDSSHYDSWNYLKATNLVKNNSKGATIEVVFRHPHFNAYEAASVVDGIDSLISSIGGILGLFLGINLINILEILYVVIKIVVSYLYCKYVE